MCGFICVINEKKFNQKLIALSNNKKINHRGPDNIKIVTLENFSTLFRRLKIIDLTTESDQPFISEDNRYTLVFNGEIYNYLILKKYLKKKGYKFHTTGDTEVLLKSYLFWGDEFVNKINGMFAICIWDNQKKKLKAFRDRFGQKPLFYYKTKNGLIISSEIKDFKNFINLKENINSSQRYIFKSFLDNNNETFFKNVFRLLPSSKLTFLNNKVEIKKYWNLKFLEKKNFDKKYFLGIFLDNLKIHMNSDVKVAAELSGGLDSSSVVAGMKKMNINFKSFSIAPKNTIDEKIYIDEFVKKFNIKHEYIKSKNKIKKKDFQQVLKYQDEPFQAISDCHQFFLKKEISKRGFKVLLTGDGGDETLGGYNRMLLIYLINLKNLKKYKLFNKILKIKNISLDKFKLLYNSLNDKFKSDIETSISIQMINKNFKEKNKTLFQKNWNEIKNLKSKNIFKETLKNSLFTNDMQMSLRLTDRNSMAFSIENRSPFLGNDFVDYVFSIKTENFIKNGISKFMLRESMHEISSPKILKRINKSGRPGNDRDFIFGDMYLTFKNYIKNANLNKIGINKNKLLKALIREKSIKKNNSILSKNESQKYNFYFRILCYLTWKKINFK